MVSVYKLCTLVNLLFLLSRISGTITQTPSSACNGEDVTVKCILKAPNTNDLFISIQVRFIIANPDAALSDNQVNSGTGDYFGTNLARLTAMYDTSSSQVVGSITLNSFTSSDKDLLLGCTANFVFFIDGDIIDEDIIDQEAVSETIPLNKAVPPSSPPVTLSEPNNNCTNIVISWTTPDSDRDIKEYSVCRNNTLLTNTTDNHYTDTNQLTINTIYEYSVTAISCAGTSIPGVNTVSIGGYSINNSPQLFLSYDNTTSILTIDWTLLPVMTPPLILEYSLDLVYNHTQSDLTHQFSSSTTFLLLSSITEYTTYITPHNFTTDDGVVTNITTCIQIIQQCGAFNGHTICRFFNAEPPTLPTTATTASVTTILSFTLPVRNSPNSCRFSCISSTSCSNLNSNNNININNIISVISAMSIALVIMGGVQEDTEY
ncbi:hypothetical protein LOD99_10831 [Oopsacas minuta]|uniref:Fibronectin type-III domain-containing protein n=1 Tax=Oopsacas minuta TaxID=111878 RepID=A0AAV7KDZ4_9METZ|nr:hypothetical protein LOD99_10831 [Oopsacas minuta]